MTCCNRPWSPVNRSPGSMSLVTERIHDYSSGTSELRDASDDESAQIETYRAPFLESVVTEAEDDDLMERYLEGEQLAVLVPGEDGSEARELEPGSLTSAMRAKVIAAINHVTATTTGSAA